MTTVTEFQRRLLNRRLHRQTRLHTVFSNFIIEPAEFTIFKLDQRTVIGSAWEDGEVRVLVLDCIDEPQP